MTRIERKAVSRLTKREISRYPNLTLSLFNLSVGRYI